MFRPRRLLIWLVLSVGLGYGIWRWRQSQAADHVPAMPPVTPRPTPASADAPAAPSGPRRIATRVHRGAPPSLSASGATATTAAVTEEPPPAPSEPPATPEQSLAPLAPEEVTSAHAEPEPPAAPEQSLAPLTPEEAVADAAEPANAGPVNINSADLQTLVDLPGIGRALATRIIAYRDQHGPFATVDDLVAIQGIGPNNINDFRELVTV